MNIFGINVLFDIIVNSFFVVRRIMAHFHDAQNNELIKSIMRTINCIFDSLLSLIDRTSMINFVMLNKYIHQQFDLRLQSFLNKKWTNESKYFPLYAADVNLFVCFRAPFDHPMSPCRIMNLLLKIRPIRLTITFVSLNALIKYSNLYQIDIIERLIHEREIYEKSKKCRQLFSDTYDTFIFDNKYEPYTDNIIDEIVPIKVLGKQLLLQKNTLIQLIGIEPSLRVAPSHLFRPDVPNNIISDILSNNSPDTLSDPSPNTSSDVPPNNSFDAENNEYHELEKNANGCNYCIETVQKIQNKDAIKASLFKKSSHLVKHREASEEETKNIEKLIAKYNNETDEYCYLNNASNCSMQHEWLTVPASVMYFEMDDQTDVTEFNKSTFEDMIIVSKRTIMDKFVNRCKYVNFENHVHGECLMNVHMCFRNINFNIKIMSHADAKIAYIALINCKNVDSSETYFSPHGSKYMTRTRDTIWCRHSFLNGCVNYERGNGERRTIKITQEIQTVNEADRTVEQKYDSIIVRHNNIIENWKGQYIKPIVSIEIANIYEPQKKINENKHETMTLISNMKLKNEFLTVLISSMFFHFYPKTITLTCFGNDSTYEFCVVSLYESLFLLNSNGCDGGDDSSEHVEKIRNSITQIKINYPKRFFETVIISQNAWILLLNLAIQLPNVTDIYLHDIALEYEHNNDKIGSSSDIHTRFATLKNDCDGIRYLSDDHNAYLPCKNRIDCTMRMNIESESQKRNIDMKMKYICVLQKDVLLDANEFCSKNMNRFVVPFIIPIEIVPQLKSIEIKTDTSSNEYLTKKLDLVEHGEINIPIYFDEYDDDYDDIMQTFGNTNTEGLYWIIKFMKTISQKYRHVGVCKPINVVIEEIKKIYLNKELIDISNSSFANNLSVCDSLIERKDIGLEETNHALDENDNELKFVMNDCRIFSMRDAQIYDDINSKYNVINPIIGLIDLISADEASQRNDHLIIKNDLMRFNTELNVECFVIFVQGEKQNAQYEREIVDLIENIIHKSNYLNVMRIITVYSEGVPKRHFGKYKQKIKKKSMVLSAKCPQNDTCDILRPLLGSGNLTNKIVKRLAKMKKLRQFILSITTQIR